MNDNNKKSNFFKKWRKQNKPLRIILLLVSIIYTTCLIFFTYSLIKLTSIETFLRIVILTILFIHFVILTLGGTIMLFTKKNNKLVITLILSVLYSQILFTVSYHIDKTYGIIDNVQKKFVEYTSVMISMKDKETYKKIGMISAKNDPEGYVIPQDIIKEQDIRGDFVEYDDYISMVSDLYDGVIDAMFVKNSYETMFNSYEKFTDISNETKVIYTKTKELENVDNVSYSTKNLTEPFTILLMGVDSTGNSISQSASFNGDTLMMITFNPKTLNATVFSIPRDTYVPIACQNGNENKINSSAYGGTSCVVKTIENLTDIKIDYYAKINFTGVVNLVDDLGGIELDVPIKFCEQDSERRFGEYEICLDKGYQRLNGEQALALARHRHSLPLGDFQRVQHQQLVVEAMVRELKNIDSTEKFYKILDDVANNIDTNMSTPQILSLYNVGKNILFSALNNTNTLSIEKTYLTGYDLTMYVDSFKSYVYTFQYYRQSLDEIVDAMKVNLELEPQKLIKSFDFDANVTYEKSVIGKKYYNESRIELLPNFVGKNRSYIEAWANERDIEVEIKEEDSTRPKGEIINQNQHAGKPVEKIDKLIITISNKETSVLPPTETPSEEPTEETIPDFEGKSLNDFNKWKNSLKGANLITEALPLSIEDILTLDEEDLEENVIYKQSIPKGTLLKDVSTLKVYYFKKES